MASMVTAVENREILGTLCVLETLGLALQEAERIPYINWYMSMMKQIWKQLQRKEQGKGDYWLSEQHE